MRAYEKKVFCLGEHLDRLSGSCRGIGRRLPLSALEIGRWLQTALKEARIADALLRLSVHWKGANEGAMLLIASEFHAHPRQWYEEGVKLKTAVQRRSNPKAQDSQVKASQFMGGVLAYLSEAGRDFHELVFLDQRGMVAEGTVSNIFILEKKRLLTPSVSSGILRGVTRGVALELAQKRRFKIQETRLTRHEVYAADECFLTNTSSEILPVVSLDGRVIGNGKPGAVTRILMTDFKSRIEQFKKKLMVLSR